MEQHTKKQAKKEDGVEDIYGVHFKYDDLFERLLKVQKERKKSEKKSPLKKTQSIEKTIKRNNSTKHKKSESKLEKKSSSRNNSKNNTKGRSSSMKKGLTKPEKDQRKSHIFQSFSPSQAQNLAKKTLVSKDVNKKLIRLKTDNKPIKIKTLSE